MGEYRMSRPGVYDIPEQFYHADPVAGGSLSSTGARALLPPGCPAKFFHDLNHPAPAKQHFEAGHAAHRLVLGAGPELRVIDATDRRKKTTKQAIKAAREEHAVPLLEPQMEIIEAMAAALRAHPIAGKLFQPGTGKAEQSLIWQDQRTGVWRRARPDWLPHHSGGRLILADYKTTMDASDDAIQRAVHKFGYHQQAAWYRDGALALNLAEDVPFVFVWQEKTAPYLVRVTQLDPTAMRIGAAKNARALDIYAHCRETRHWPGYSDEVDLVSLPVWAENRDTMEYL
jgi:PDDEXK-like domain of unknown function (DUF3799)